MDIITVLQTINTFSAAPSTILFLSVGIILTLKLRFLQIRGIPYFFRVLKKSIHSPQKSNQGSLSSLKALMTAMATTLGMGNVVGPSVAIMMGGPGALFWLLLFPFFGGLLKFVEVVFAFTTRKTMKSGALVGGPAEYLGLISPHLGNWYGLATIFLFTTWSALQSNTLAQILFLEGADPIITGLILASLLALVVFGGVKRIGDVASFLVPIMFVTYVSFAFFVLLQNASILPGIIKLIVSSALSPQATVGGLAGASIVHAMRYGTYRSIFITEAGLGTSSIAHSLAQVERPTDQGLLAMYSITLDAFLSFLSGMLVLITGLWQRSELDSTVIYQAFKKLSPIAGKYALLFGIGLFVITTIIGNTLNGSQSFAALTRGRFIKGYFAVAILGVFFGAIVNVSFLWEFSDVILTFVAIPNVLGILYLVFRRSESLKLPIN